MPVARSLLSPATDRRQALGVGHHRCRLPIQSHHPRRSHRTAGPPPARCCRSMAAVISAATSTHRTVEVAAPLRTAGHRRLHRSRHVRAHVDLARRMRRNVRDRTLHRVLEAPRRTAAGTASSSPNGVRRAAAGTAAPGPARSAHASRQPRGHVAPPCPVHRTRPCRANVLRFIRVICHEPRRAIDAHSSPAQRRPPSASETARPAPREPCSRP